MENLSASPPITKKIKLDFKDSKYATGKRKRSIAKVWVKKGSGNIYVNGIKMNEGAVLLGLVGSVGHGGSAWRTLKKKSYVSELQVDCKEGKIPETTCKTITNSMKLF